MKKAIVIFLLFLLVSGCSKDDDSNLKMSIIETGCANAWDDFYDGTHDYKHAVTKYLNLEGVDAYKVYSKQYYDGPVCLACTCPTGRYIIIEIDYSDLSEAKKLGFSIYRN